MLNAEDHEDDDDCIVMYALARLKGWIVHELTTNDK